MAIVMNMLISIMKALDAGYVFNVTKTLPSGGGTILLRFALGAGRRRDDLKLFTTKRRILPGHFAEIATSHPAGARRNDRICLCHVGCGSNHT
jgi:hypothetical protein